MEKKRIYPENTPPGNIPYNVVNPAFRYRAIVPADDSIVMEVDANGVLYVSAQGLRVKTPVAKIVIVEDKQYLILSSETEGASIFYTLNGSSPIIGISDNYTFPINIPSVKVGEGYKKLIFVAAKNGLVNSFDNKFSFYVPFTPSINIDKDGIVEIQNNDSVQSQIYYTLDGSFPTADSTLYEQPFTVVPGTLVKAIAYYDGIYGGEAKGEF